MRGWRRRKKNAKNGVAGGCLIPAAKSGSDERTLLKTQGYGILTTDPDGSFTVSVRGMHCDDCHKKPEVKMTAEIKELKGGKILEVRTTGKLAKQDYEHFVPITERLIGTHGKIRILFEMHDFHGWEAGALWEDIKFDVKHFRDIERLAIVGETKWEKGMAVFCRPFTTAKVRYFDTKDIDQARQWIEGD
jgi:TusA-related sulfurtransferase